MDKCVSYFRYKAKDVYREIRLTDPHQHEGELAVGGIDSNFYLARFLDMDLYSTLLWHCQEKFELSKLAMDLKDSSKKSPQVGNACNDFEVLILFYRRGAPWETCLASTTTTNQR